jgi:hypothetical protein
MLVQRLQQQFGLGGVGVISHAVIFTSTTTPRAPGPLSNLGNPDAIAWPPQAEIRGLLERKCATRTVTRLMSRNHH